MSFTMFSLPPLADQASNADCTIEVAQFAMSRGRRSRSTSNPHCLASATVTN